MKRTCLIVFALLGSVALRAQEEKEHPSAPPLENLSFLTDEYIYIPKYKFSLGMRGLSGSKTSFSGHGVVASALDYIGPATGTGINRVYHDGTVTVDTRTISVDDGNGSTFNVPITPDGKTNNWAYADPSQVTSAGNIAMHSYSANTVDTGPRTKDTDSAFGFEVIVSRDMGKIGKRLEWNLDAGFSLNDLKAGLRSAVTSQITTTTDIYSLNGAPAPQAPYGGAATASTTTVVDASGNPVLNSDGTAKVLTPDTVTLLGSEPLSRNTPTPVTDTTSVINTWKLKGAYFTFRAGPTLSLPITQHLYASVSAGPALVYAGTTYSVTQNFQPKTGDPIVATMNDTSIHFLPGFYADADLEYWVTDTAGFYAGAVYQNTGEFTQDLKTSVGDFTTKVDLSSLSGMRAGMNIKF